MPYVSQAQQGYFHTPAGMAKVGPKVVAEFDAASKGDKDLPKRAPKKAAGREGRSAVDYGAMVAHARSFA